MLVSTQEFETAVRDGIATLRDIYRLQPLLGQTLGLTPDTFVSAALAKAGMGYPGKDRDFKNRKQAEDRLDAILHGDDYNHLLIKRIEKISYDVQMGRLREPLAEGEATAHDFYAVALGVLDCYRRKAIPPGNITTSLKAYDEDLRKAQEAHEAACLRVGKSWGPEHIEVREVSSPGMAWIEFKGCGIGPTPDPGETGRGLVAFLTGLSEETTKKRLKILLGH